MIQVFGIYNAPTQSLPGVPVKPVENVMSKIILSSIAVAALAFAAPALAAPATGPDGMASNGTVPDAGKSKPKRDQRYCVVYNITGSILPHKTCKTRQDWLAEGFDPLAKQ